MALGKLWYYALAIGSISGTIIGVGMFGLPYAALKGGFFLTAFYLVFFGIIVGLTHLLYLEVTLRTKTNHRFTGYVGRYLGPRWKAVTFLQGLVTLWGTLLVYTIVASSFLHLLLPSLSSQMLGIMFFLIGSIIIWRGDMSVGKQEFFFIGPMALIIVAIFVKALLSPSFSETHLFTGRISEWTLPYGIVLFSLSGFSIIPLIEHLLSPARKKGMSFNYPLIVLTGTLIPAFLYILFTWGVLGIAGSQVSENALSGLDQFLGKGIVGAGALLAILAMYTSFIAVGNELRNMMREDYVFRRMTSFLFALGVPFFLYLLNVLDFITLAEFVGAVMGGYIGVLSVLLFWKAKRWGDEHPPFAFHLPTSLGIFIIIIFTFASLYALFDIVSPLIFPSLPN